MHLFFLSLIFMENIKVFVILTLFVLSVYSQPVYPQPNYAQAYAAATNSYYANVYKGYPVQPVASHPGIKPNYPPQSYPPNYLGYPPNYGYAYPPQANPNYHKFPDSKSQSPPQPKSSPSPLPPPTGKPLQPIIPPQMENKKLSIPLPPTDLGEFSREKFTNQLKSSLPKLSTSVKEVLFDKKTGGSKIDISNPESKEQNLKPKLKDFDYNFDEAANPSRPKPTGPPGPSPSSDQKGHAAPAVAQKKQQSYNESNPKRAHDNSVKGRFNYVMGTSNNVIGNNNIIRNGIKGPKVKI